MLTDKAKAMMLLNEAARLNRKTEALKIVCEQGGVGTVADWKEACRALEALLGRTVAPEPPRAVSHR